MLLGSLIFGLTLRRKRIRRVKNVSLCHYVYLFALGAMYSFISL
jgi:hypothetical protein